MMAKPFHLRPLSIADAEALYRLADDSSIWAHTQPPEAKTLGEWKALITNLVERPWVFVACIDDDVCGSFSMLRQSGQYSHRAEIGGWLHPKYWGYGFATLAFDWLAKYGLSQGLQRIEARGAEDNPAVCNAGIKAGFVLESVADNAIMRQGKTIAELVFVYPMSNGEKSPCLG